MSDDYSPFYSHLDECPNCKGFGWKCEACKGKGKVMAPPTISVHMYCTACGGRGTLGGMPCHCREDHSAGESR